MALEQSKLESLCVGLHERGALQFSDFEWTLKSGRRSPIYYNQRKLASLSPAEGVPRERQREIRGLAVEAYSEAIDDLGQPYDHLYGIPQAMTTLGAMVAYQRGDSILWGRVGDKKYGQHTPIEGNFQSSDEVVALDDVITTAASKIETAESLDEAELACNGFAVMLDREEGGQQEITGKGYNFIAVFGLGRAMEILKANNRIGNQEFEWVEQYRQQLSEA